ncbi:MAG: 4Fe-4S binding protein [Bacillota bacterium]|nr:4Fe-4S binding protein [Bacillota bacterium]
MLNVLLVYFSGTGITRYYASLIQEEMEKRGYNCDLLNLEEFTDLPTLWQKKPVALNYTIRAEKKRPLSKYPWPYLDIKSALKSVDSNPLFGHLAREWSDYDLIGFGSPVYAFRPAPVMIRFLLDLPAFNKKIRVFSFATHDGAQGDYQQFMKDILTMKGFRYIGHLDQSFIYSAAAVMRRNFSYLDAGRQLIRKSFQARKNIFIFLEYVHSLFYGIPYWYKQSNLLANVVGIPMRIFYSYGIDFLLNHFLFGYGIHKDECILCMTCVQQCPQGLIELDDEGYPIRLYHCMYCLRCLNWCPTDALYFSNVTDGKARFPGPEVLLETALEESMDRRLKG